MRWRERREEREITNRESHPEGRRSVRDPMFGAERVLEGEEEDLPRSEPTEEHHSAREPFKVRHNGDFLPLIAMAQAILKAHLQVFPNRPRLMTREVLADFDVDAKLPALVKSSTHFGHQTILVVLTRERALDPKGKHVGRKVCETLNHSSTIAKSWFPRPMPAMRAMFQGTWELPRAKRPSSGRWRTDKMSRLRSEIDLLDGRS